MKKIFSLPSLSPSPSPPYIKIAHLSFNKKKKKKIKRKFSQFLFYIFCFSHFFLTFVKSKPYLNLSFYLFSPSLLFPSLFLFLLFPSIFLSPFPPVSPSRFLRDDCKKKLNYLTFSKRKFLWWMEERKSERVKGGGERSGDTGRERERERERC